MASIKEQPRLIDRIALNNMLSDDRGLAVTALLSGQHGIGKSMIVKKAAKKLNAECITVTCSECGEGTLTGLPFAMKNEDTGSMEVRFIKFYAFNKLADLQKHYYEIATTTGFFDGALKMDAKTGIVTYENPETKQTETYNTSDAATKILDGGENKYKFGETLPRELKAKLISSGEIRPVFILLDEINRTDVMTQKEIMNIILNRAVNGYDLPWWSEIVAAMNPVSQNSSYAVNEMDPAQLDRFLKIKVHANLDEWIDYALDKKLNQDIITGLAMAEDCFLDKKDKSLTDETEMTPSPRSWEMVANLYETIKEYNTFKINDQPVFTDEEQHKVNDDIRTLMISKVGQTAASTVLAAIADKENSIKASEILTATSPKIDEVVMTKLKSLKSLRKKIVVDNVIRYIQDHILEYEKNNRSSDPKIKSKYFNFMAQIKEFVNSLDGASRLLFVTKISDENLTVDDNGKKSMLFVKVASCFASDVLQELLAFRKDSNQMNSEK